MKVEELRELLDYHYWARDRLLDAVEELDADDIVRDLGSSFGSIRDTLAHIYSAEWIWCSRWEGESPNAMLDSTMFSDVAALREAWKRHEERMRSVFKKFRRDGVGQVVEYRDTRGNVWRQTYEELLRHVVNHASYHRGQITTMLRQLGAAPAESMDLIAFYRARDESAA